MARALLSALLLGALGCASPPATAPTPCGEDDDAPAPSSNLVPLKVDHAKLRRAVRDAWGCNPTIK